MAPPTEAFPPSQLAARINTTPSGKRRKPPIADLADCALKEMLQYHCELVGPREDSRSEVRCWPVVRLFRMGKRGVGRKGKERGSIRLVANVMVARRCAGGLTVEVTSLEGHGEE
ncbi:hypothetical protein LTR28_012802 [Elasticomyces elasticus]|nr:hypothetical protein LTR28_012802 [Elasticomyces elasticus]